MATSLVGCMKELLNRFRYNSLFEAAVLAVRPTGVDIAREGLAGSWHDDELDDDLQSVPLPPGPDHDVHDGLSEWLDAQEVVVATLPEPSVMIDAYATSTLADLDSHPAVRRVLDSPAAASLRGPEDRPPRLDQTAIHLFDDHVGRPLTQAVSRVIYEAQPPCAGMGYRSRVDRDEECWALFDRTPVEFAGPPEKLSSMGAPALKAVAEAAALLDVVVPPTWRQQEESTG